MYLITILTHNDSANIFPDIYTCLCRRQCLIFIRALQMLSGFSVGMMVLLSFIYWMVAFSLVIAMLTRHIDMPVLLSKSMFHIGSAWLVFTLYMIFALLIADVTKLFVPSLNHGFYYALGVTCCLLIQRIIFVRTSFQNRDE